MNMSFLIAFTVILKSMQNLCITGKKVVLTSIIFEDVDCRAAIQCPIYLEVPGPLLTFIS